VNAPAVAAEQGLEVRPTSTTTSRDYVNLITLRGGDHSLSGTLVGLNSQPTLVMIDDHTVDVPPAANLLVVRNEDRPGMIGKVATLVGDAGVNIDDMAVGASAEGAKALMVVATDRLVDDATLASLRNVDGVQSVAAVSS
jgi:D-3-phosphoglycerate dehydrogenase